MLTKALHHKQICTEGHKLEGFPRSSLPEKISLIRLLCTIDEEEEKACPISCTEMNVWEEEDINE
jgi:hypothetical protein